jgi:hypothetical protein
MKIIKCFSLAVPFFLAASPVFAQAPRDVLYSSEVFQSFDVKIINDIGLILPIIVAWFAIKVAALMRGGKLEDVWKLIAAGMSVLAIVKVVDGLETLGILYVGGLREVLEFVMILVFFAAFLMAYRSLVMAIRGPIPVESPKIEVPEEKKEKKK